jgi:cysteinyl-tRNA synthetase
MTLKIYNTASKKKDIFKPIAEGQVGLYVCGMTVYDLCHLGHARVMVAFDVIYRYLTHKGFDVTYVRNITDVDDKILARAKRDDVNFIDLVNEMIIAMDEDFNYLSILKPTKEPKATDHINDIFDLIFTLLEKEYAYIGDNGDIYFRVKHFKEYGKLSGRNIEQLKPGIRVAIDTFKEDPLDFVLWKSVSDKDVFWKSPWGNGRPGWHIECSAMSMCSLGNNYDIHGGGPDLKFPHHENEIAQSEAATGEHYANTWMHAGPLLVDGKKMSKSLNNFFTIRDLIKDYDPEILRLFLLSSHYRSGVDYSTDSIGYAGKKLGKLYSALQWFSPKTSFDESDPLIKELVLEFYRAMDDDFNTPQALAVLFSIVSLIDVASYADRLIFTSTLKYLSGILGLLSRSPSSYFDTGLTSKDIDQFIIDRAIFKAEKDFKESDSIRDYLFTRGIELKDTPDGTIWSYIY